MIDFKKELFANAYKRRIPLTATIEIISQCNFRCVHCYIGNEYRKNMLTYEEIEDFGNQIIQMGCLYVVLTGGEVLLHPEFEKIYLFFVKKGVCVSVFTNGSLIDSKIVSLFVKYPPRVVEITMYGFYKETYEHVTKLESGERVQDNIILLKQNGINVLLKMFVMEENYNDFNKVYRFAVEHDIPFKYDSMIIAGSDSEEMKHQIADEYVLELNKQEKGTDKKYNKETYEFIMGSCNKKLFLCGAGRSSCWLKSNNCLRLCNFLDCIEFDLKNYRVNDAWDMFKTYIEKEIPQSSECSNCKYRSFCDYCPAKSYASFGKFDMESHADIYCRIAKERAFTQINKK